MSHKQKQNKTEEFLLSLCSSAYHKEHKYFNNSIDKDVNIDDERWVYKLIKSDNQDKNPLSVWPTLHCKLTCGKRKIISAVIHCLAYFIDSMKVSDK